MKVAVITPAYNAEKHIESCVKSVKWQVLDPGVTVTHYVFDDGSTDSTRQKLDGADVVLLSSSENRGVSFARNELLHRATQDKCDYVAFLDADDVWLPNHLSICLSDIGDSDLAYTQCAHFFEDGEPCEAVNISTPRVFIGKFLMRGNFIFTPCVIAKAPLFTYNRFDSLLNGLEDWDMWYRLWEQGCTFKAVNEITAHHTVRRDSMAGTGQEKMDAFRAKHKTLDNIKLHLACGTDYHDDYINVDLYADAKADARFDVKTLPFDDNSVDEIKAFHIIEHFDWHEGNRVLKEWARVLKPGGRILIETPDLYESCKHFARAYEANDELSMLRMYGHMFSEAWEPGQAHLFLFTDRQLATQLGWAGFKDVRRLPPSSRYLQWHPAAVFLCVEATKA